MTVSADPGAEIRHRLLSVTTATLSTLAAERDVAGWPFGSLAPFALRADGTPIVLLSEIAQHTKNLRRDPRVSLFVRDPYATGDAQASWRITVLARARAIAVDGELEEIHARYRERVPTAPSYLGTHDFTYFALEPVRVRAIGGFGSIRWLEPGAIFRDPQGGGLREDPDEDRNLAGTPAEKRAAELLRAALVEIEAPDDQLARLGLE